jgi:hypothetical protein
MTKSIEAMTTLAEMRAEGGGLLEFKIIGPWNCEAIGEAWKRGDRMAARWGLAVSRAIATLRWHDGSQRCGCCQRVFRAEPIAFAAIIPAVEDPSNALAVGLCRRCVRRGPVIELSVRRSLGSAFRFVDPAAISSEWGRA